MSKVERINKVELSPIEPIKNDSSAFSDIMKEKHKEKEKQNKGVVKVFTINKESHISEEILKNNPPNEFIEKPIDLLIIEKQRNILTKNESLNIETESNSLNMLTKNKMKKKVEDLYIKNFEEKRNILK